ncbi:MAG: hypothetical protein HQK53_18845 [Oligoflexia bacterium]|nr:hypothetical protein [Oligoflexia bacterium]
MILLKKDGEKKKQTIELSGKSIVHGDIILEQNDAEVIVGKYARVEGKIIRDKN